MKEYLPPYLKWKDMVNFFRFRVSPRPFARPFVENTLLLEITLFAYDWDTAPSLFPAPAVAKFGSPKVIVNIDVVVFIEVEDTDEADEVGDNNSDAVSLNVIVPLKLLYIDPVAGFTEIFTRSNIFRFKCIRVLKDLNASKSAI